MSFHGDIALGDTIDIKFSTVDSAGLPTTLAGTPAVAAYPDGSLTEVTAGVTLTVDFDGRTGLHNVQVVATAGNGFATDTNYALVITTGTVDGSTVEGYVVGSFSIEARPLNAAKLTTDAVNEIRDAILSDSTPFAGANVDAAISSRATPTEVNAEVDTALADIHLDHLLAVDYDPAAQPGVATALLNELVEGDGGGVSRFTVGAVDRVWSVATRVLTANTNLNDPTAAAIRDAILDRVLSGNHDTADTPGDFLQQLDALISSRSSHAASAVLAETLSELTQGAPAATPSLADAIMLLYMAMRNAETQSASEYTVANDAGTVIAKSSLSDDGTTVTKAEMVTGP